jgi:hypothetical protein
MDEPTMPADSGNYNVKGSPESPVLCPGTAPVAIDGQLSNLRVALDLFTELRTILLADVKRAFQEADEAMANGATGQDLQRPRRNAARALFSYIEAVVYAMKRTALRMEQLHPDKLFLTEEIEQLEEKGPPWPSAKENLRFAFDAFVRRHQGPKLVPRGPGWAAYCRASEIRDHLMHPKSVAHVTIDGGRYTKDLMQARKWIDAEFDKAARAVYQKAKGRKVELQNP